VSQLATYAVTALDGVAFGLLLFVVAAGLALIFGVLQVFNLAHGTLYLAGAYLAYALGDGGMASLIGAAAAGVVLGAGGGLVLSAALRPLAGRGHLDQALATFGIAFVVADVFTTIFGSAPLPTAPPKLLSGSIEMAGHGYPVYRLTFIAVAVVLAAGLHVMVRHTTAGAMLRATVSDPAMAAATGINTTRARHAAMAAGGALAVAGGVLGAPLLGPAPGADMTVLVLSLVVVIVGGGSILGTLAAALLVGQVQTVGVLAAPVAAPFALFAVMFMVLLIRPPAAPLGPPR